MSKIFFFKHTTYNSKTGKYTITLFYISEVTNVAVLACEVKSGNSISPLGF